MSVTTQAKAHIRFKVAGDSTSYYASAVANWVLLPIAFSA
jgi:hypothetical protein